MARCSSRNCEYCVASRTHSSRVREQAAIEALREFESVEVVIDTADDALSAIIDNMILTMDAEDAGNRVPFTSYLDFTYGG